MAVYVIFGLLLGALGVALVLFVKSYRLLRRERPQLSHTQRRPEDQTLWEAGQSLTDLHQEAHSSSPMVKRRGFLARLALGLLGAIAALAAARGEKLAGAEGFLTNPELSLEPGNEGSTNQCHHTDTHTGHIDVPSEVGYADIAPRHMDYTDCPPPPHYDHYDHYDHHDHPHVDTPHGDSGGLSQVDHLGRVEQES